MNELTGSHTLYHSLGTAAVSSGRFVLSFLEMLIAMMAGMIIFVPVKIALVSQGYDPALSDPASIDYQALMAPFMVLPMVLWMRLRGCHWREAAEMSAGMLVPVAVVLLLCAVAHVTWLSPRSSMPVMAAGMLLIMLYRHGRLTFSYSVRRRRA